MSVLELYLLFIFIPKIKVIMMNGVVLIIVLAIIATIVNLCYIVETGEMAFKGEKLASYTKKLFIICCILTTLSIIIPTKEEMAILYVVPKISNNEEAQKLPSNVLKTINSYLDDLSRKVSSTTVGEDNE